MLNLTWTQLHTAYIFIPLVPSSTMVQCHFLKKQQTKINMTVKPYQVNYKKYFIFLEFDFQIMLPLHSQF